MAGRRGAGGRPRAAAFAELPAAVGALGALAVLAWLFAQRVGYPFDLEWMEGGMLAQALRVVRGEPLYVRPSPDYVPFIYPPLYPWVLGLLGRIFELGYPLGRAVSFAGTLAAAAVLVAALRREGLGWGMAAGGAGLFLSAYDDTGSFYDLVRVDGLFVALWAGALVLVRAGRLRAGGLLLALAFAAKQSAAAAGLPALAWLWLVRGRRDALRFAAWSAGPALAGLALMQLEGDGLFLTYLLGVPAHHGFVLDRFFPGAERELLAAMPWAAAAGAAGGLAAWWVGGRRVGEGTAYWLAQAAVAVVVCAVMRGHQGGYLNVLVPGAWALALLWTLGLGAAAARWPHPLVRLAAALVLGGQALVGLGGVERYLPTEADRAAGERVIAALREVDGPVLAPWSPWYPVLAGKEPSFHLIALWDVEHEGGPLRDDARAVRRALDEGRWAAVLVAGRDFGRALEGGWRKERTFRYRGRAFYPKTGWQVRPRALYVREEGG